MVVFVAAGSLRRDLAWRAVDTGGLAPRVRRFAAAVQVSVLLRARHRFQDGEEADRGVVRLRHGCV